MLLARPAIRREAVSTSALEGTYAAFDDVLEADFLGSDDLSPALAEVHNYVRAAELAFDWVTDRPITTGMLAELQKEIVKGTRGDTADAGRLRTIHVFIGQGGGGVQDARFVPPPPGPQLKDGVEAWISWLRRDVGLPTVAKMALGHYQFGTLHPFNDGNGRLGRLVCVLQLAAGNELRVPILNLSPWFEQRRREYQELLLQTSMHGRFDPWIVFFCTAVLEQAKKAAEKVERLLEGKDQTVTYLRANNVRGVAARIAEDLIGYPAMTARIAATIYNVSYVAANNAIGRLESLGILHERTGKKYARVFYAREVYQIIEN